MSEKVESVLTEQEWRSLGPNGVGHPPMPSTLADIESLDVDDLPKAIAIANATLPYSDDRKIKSHWVSWLREEADILKRNRAGAGSLIATEIADALESYLPPETV